MLESAGVTSFRQPGFVILRSWVFVVSRLVGLWPFDVRGGFDRASFFRGVVSVSLPMMIFVYTRTTNLFDILQSTETYNVIKLMRHILGFFIEMVMCLGCVAQVHVVRRMRRTIQSVTTSLARTKIRTRALDLSTAAVLSGQLVLCYTAYAVFYRVNVTAVIGCINVIYVTTVNYISILQFCAISISLEIQLKEETASLKRQISLDRHARILQMCRTANVIYRKQTLLSITQIFGYLVAYLYYLIADIVEGEIFFEYTIFLSINLVTRFSMLMLIAFCSERLKTEAEAFNSELFNLTCRNSHMCKNKKLTLYVKMRPSMNFTACGFFDLGYPLVTSIIAAVTTYLVILLQFTI